MLTTEVRKAMWSATKMLAAILCGVGFIGAFAIAIGWALAHDHYLIGAALSVALIAAWWVSVVIDKVRMERRWKS